MGQENQGRYVSAGLAIDHTPGSDVAAGDVVIQNNIVGIAKVPIEGSVLGALATAGVFDIVKKQEAFTSVGAKIYWDATGDPYDGDGGTGAATATSSHTFLGFVLAAAEATDEVVRVLVVQSASADEAWYGAYTKELTGQAALNALHLTVDDECVFTTGEANALLLTHNNRGAKTGTAASRLNSICVRTTLYEAAHYNGLYVRIDDSGSPDLSTRVIAGVNVDMKELGATDYFTNLWLQKANTTKGNVDAFILASLQASAVARSVIHCQGINLPDELLRLPGSPRDMWSAAAPTGTLADQYLKVRVGDAGVEYKILMESTD